MRKRLFVDHQIKEYLYGGKIRDRIDKSLITWANHFIDVPVQTAVNRVTSSPIDLELYKLVMNNEF